MFLQVVGQEESSSSGREVSLFQVAEVLLALLQLGAQAVVGVQGTAVSLCPRNSAGRRGHDGSLCSE